MKALQRGMTLVELVVAVALTAIVVSFGISFIAAPVQTLDTSARRERLVNDATAAAESFTRDVGTALPGSIRIRANGANLALEFLQVMDSAGALPDVLASGPAELLLLGTPDASFETLGSFRNLRMPIDSRRLYLAVHVPAILASPYAFTSLLTPAGTRIQISAGASADQDRIRLTPAMLYTAIGTQRRLYLVSGPVTWLCDSSSGQLRRYSGYSIDSDQAQRDTPAKLLAAGATTALLAESVSDCGFIQHAQTAAALSTAIFRITLMNGNERLSASASAVVDDAG
jgi:MSHA biogenesis protein MshO